MSTRARTKYKVAQTFGLALSTPRRNTGAGFTKSGPTLRGQTTGKQGKSPNMSGLGGKKTEKFEKAEKSERGKGMTTSAQVGNNV